MQPWLEQDQRFEPSPFSLKFYGSFIHLCIPIIDCCVTNHPRTQSPKTVRVIHVTHVPVMQKGLSGYGMPLLHAASANGAQLGLEPTLTERAGKVVSAVGWESVPLYMGLTKTC